jgi:hypothetical protein
MTYLKIESIGVTILSLPCYVISVGVTEVLLVWINRNKQFKQISFNRILTTLINILITLIWSLTVNKTFNGLITGMIILRRHNEPDSIQTMEDWWTEISYRSKRDQLSFNYCAWKNNLNLNYIPGDSRNNEYFINVGKHVGKK